MNYRRVYLENSKIFKRNKNIFSRNIDETKLEDYILTEI